MPVYNRDYLKALDIDVWIPRDEVENHKEDNRVQAGIINNNEAVAAITDSNQNQPVPARIVEPNTNDVVAYGVATYDWPELQQAVMTCTLCELAQSRTQAVFGVGNHQADLMIIGEAPGVDEDKQGEPFVGKAGQLLNAMLKAIGFTRTDVYIANILKCRPPNNRDPKPEEAILCSSYLHRQIALVKPKLILALGRIAAQRLLDTSTTLGRMRGQVYHLEENNTPLMVTYHPAYLLRSPAEKSKSWEDLKACKRFIHAASQREGIQ